jgi:hypothetical protein
MRFPSIKEVSAELRAEHAANCQSQVSYDDAETMRKLCKRIESIAAIAYRAGV